MAWKTWDTWLSELKSAEHWESY